ncbi:MAG TPA: hypothetical protein VJK72_03075 [Candidatus Nanoarchaeia archaeon]|nr:hypothetical protein [Candidatus Nanoarchaeia archaeon]
MLDKDRIRKAELGYQDYLGSNQVIVKHKEIGKYVKFFLTNAETSLLTAKTLLDISENSDKKEALAIDRHFESFLWVVVSSYYSMFYASLALLAQHNIKVGEQSKHKVVADTLIAQFIANKRLAKLLEGYEKTKETALGLIAAEEKAKELVEHFDFEREKRNTLQYELGAEAKQNLARTSLNRASAFVAEIRLILREDLKI